MKVYQVNRAESRDSTWVLLFFRYIVSDGQNRLSHAGGEANLTHLDDVILSLDL